MRRIAIIGAGPIGLEAALHAAERGDEFTIYERGEVAEAMRQWGHVRMFSPFAMNASERGLVRLNAEGAQVPRPDALLTGAEFRESYLQPLARSFCPHLRERTAVRAISRSRRLKGDFISDPIRGAQPFRLLVENEPGEHVAQADLVLDCSGTYAQPNSLGDGGIPAPGETAAGARIFHGIPDLHDSAARYAGKRVLVVGAGHSAATAVRNLAELPAETEIHWLIRRDRAQPMEVISGDPLTARRRLGDEGNRLVEAERVRFIAGATIEALESTTKGIEVRLIDARGKSQRLTVDEIVAATGFRPDLALTRELQLQTCWATEGTYPLAASLLGEAGADCLATPVFGAETLRHPEPGYFTLGMKSYGRSPNFLLRTGYEQVAAVFSSLGEKGAS